MNDKPFIKINPVILIAIIMQGAFIILAIISLTNLLNVGNKAPVVRIDNYSAISASIDFDTDLKDIPTDQQEIINQALHHAVTLNTDKEFKSSGAKIREDSIFTRYIDKLGTNYANFIVDIEELGQSYQIVYRYIKEEPENLDLENIPLVMVFCPKTENLIYGDFGCKDEYNGQGEKEVVYEIFHNIAFDDFVAFPIGDPYNGGDIVFSIVTRNNDDETIDAAVGELSEYMGSLGFNLDDYQYSASTCGICGPQN